MSLREDLVWPLHSFSVIGDKDIYFHTKKHYLSCSAAESGRGNWAFPIFKHFWTIFFKAPIKANRLGISKSLSSRLSSVAETIRVEYWEAPLCESTDSFVLLSSVNRNHANPMENVPWLCHISPNHLHRNFGSPTTLSRLSRVLENHNSYCISRMFLRFCHLTKPRPVFYILQPFFKHWNSFQYLRRKLLAQQLSQLATQQFAQ